MCFETVAAPYTHTTNNNTKQLTTNNDTHLAGHVAAVTRPPDRPPVLGQRGRAKLFRRPRVAKRERVVVRPVRRVGRQVGALAAPVRQDDAGISDLARRPARALVVRKQPDVVGAAGAVPVGVGLLHVALELERHERGALDAHVAGGAPKRVVGPAFFCVCYFCVFCF